ncbi:MAG: TonB family protein [Cryomorphaceae bacterium]|jgi:protein TonB|nr:TonB family protein [Cryomorphaceae bacterium]MDG1888807.1 TonB family protein [Flavobacteriaceae bacterium]MBT3503394.1 TonB family protein [Cryomorphaceae bacterium]MBT3688874.1 TonB family protein [Cryomorphaceae bacterium]MBT4222606.1 TonB family protein [Cryomorphaceae bacterium]
MQLKKNPNADLNKDRNLYFVIGLTLVLGLTWGAVEYKSYERTFDSLNGDMLVDDEEDVPITEQLKTPPPPPPPPPPAPEVIEIVEDEEEVEETVIESTESDEEMVIEDIVVEDDFDDIEVPFAVIEDVPIFPGCESVSKSQRRACFQEQMNKHIRKNFRYPDIAQEMGIQGRVYVNFIISRDGSITNIRMRGPDKNLENEAARIIGRLPRMTPGRQRGVPVKVPFSIPITFRLQ